MTDHESPPAAAPAPAPAGDAGTEAELRTALAQAEATAADNWNRYLRAAAELDNARRRAARDVEQARRSGLERLAQELISVIDGLEMGLGTARNASVETLVEGQQASLRLLQGVFAKVGIDVLDPAGQAFDPQLHEAMSLQPAPGATPGSVLAVMQRGYRLGDRLLRPARVVVAGEVPAADPAASGEPGPGTDA
jgi:molecular chaperone GrpE